MIRRAEVRDYKEIYLINKNSLGYEYPPDKTKELLEMLVNDESYVILVYELDCNVVGYIHIQEYQTLYFDKFYNCLGLAVDNDYKRQGIGKALLYEAEKIAEENGAVGIRLNSGSVRTDAHKFYEACDYECSKMQKNFKKFFYK